MEKWTAADADMAVVILRAAQVVESSRERLASHACSRARVTWAQEEPSTRWCHSGAHRRNSFSTARSSSAANCFGFGDDVAREGFHDPAVGPVALAPAAAPFALS